MQPAPLHPLEPLTDLPLEDSGGVASGAIPQAAVAPPEKVAPSPAASPDSGATRIPGSPAPLAITSGASATMDRDFIVRNQIVERYLAGRLPLAGRADFERYCRAHPQLLDELGISDRINAAIRLLDAAGQPGGWHDSAARTGWRPQWLIGAAVVVAALASCLAVVANNSAQKTRRIERLQQQATLQPLDPATHTRTLELVPSRGGVSIAPAAVIGGGPAELVDLQIDARHSNYKSFRVTIDRLEQGRVAILHNLTKDSNGRLRLALNSSALGPGNYRFTIEGLSWRGEPQPDSWLTIGVQRQTVAP